MTPVLTFAVLAVTVAVAEVVPQGAGSNPNTDVVLTSDKVPETIRAADGIIVTNGTPDKRCWVFIPLPPPNTQPNSRRPFYYNPYYWRYPYMLGRRPTNRPQNSGNNQNGNVEDLPMFEANNENQLASLDKQFLNGLTVNEDDNGVYAGENLNDYV